MAIQSTTSIQELTKIDNIDEITDYDKLYFLGSTVKNNNSDNIEIWRTSNLNYDLLYDKIHDSITSTMKFDLKNVYETSDYWNNQCEYVYQNRQRIDTALSDFPGVSSITGYVSNEISTNLISVNENITTISNNISNLWKMLTSDTEEASSITSQLSIISSDLSNLSATTTALCTDTSALTSLSEIARNPDIIDNLKNLDKITYVSKIIGLVQSISADLYKKANILENDYTPGENYNIVENLEDILGFLAPVSEFDTLSDYINAIVGDNLANTITQNQSIKNAISSNINTAIGANNSDLQKNIINVIANDINNSTGSIRPSISSYMLNLIQTNNTIKNAIRQVIQ